ncbi:RNA polymerase sigma factor [Allosphingosinicella humi]
MSRLTPAKGDGTGSEPASDFRHDRTPSFRRQAHGTGLCSCVRCAPPTIRQRQRWAESAVMRLNGICEQIALTVAEGDPLPPEDPGNPGRAAALTILYRRHRARLLDFVRRRMGRAGAEDTVQQTFCRLAGLDQRQFDAIVSTEAYLVRTSDNLMRDEARAAVRHSASLHVHEGDVPLRGHDQIAALEARDSLRRIEAALMRLKPRTREIFLAHRIDGYSYAEIAARTGLSIKTVEMHMTRAIAHLDRYRVTA